MIDQYGRKIDYMRISVTDRCNLRCRYCMPEQGIDKVTHEEMLSYEEILRLCWIVSALGIRKIKITGGEPLVRLGVCNLIRAIKGMKDIEQVTLTTNGVMLPAMAKELLATAIDGINISLDTLRASDFTALTGQNRLTEVLAGLTQLLQSGYKSVKINCLPLAGINDDQLVTLAGMAKEQFLTVRFIELMPMGCGTAFLPITMSVVRQKLQEAYGMLTPYRQVLGNGPARYFSLPGFRGKIGFIEAMNHKFCGDCNRIRITSGGFLKLCLQYDKGLDLRELLRHGGSDEKIRQEVARYIYKKPQEHHFGNNDVDEHWDHRNMVEIGG